LTATYAVLREGREGEALDDLDASLGFEVEEEPNPMPEHGSTFGKVIQGDFGQGGDVITVA
jgi:hypothetical protein